MSGAEAGGAGGGGGGFTFNFFGGGNGGGAGPSAATTADNKAASSKKAATAAAAAIADSDASDTSDASDADADAEEERAQEAAAEAAADALLAAINEEGPPPGGWAYREAAEELEGLLPALAPSPSGGGAGGGDDSAGGGIDLVELPGCGGLALAKRRVASGAAAALLGEAAVTESDLVPGRYEGGFKLWEGGVDLAAYVARLHGLTAATLLGAAGAPPATGLESLRVLELGCGHGLPGLVCLLAGAEVHFNDYNAEVLAALTAPNVAANLARLGTVDVAGAGAGAADGGAGAAQAAAQPHPQPPPLRPRPRFFAGDWRAVGELLAAKGLAASYDLILTAETIYSPQGAARLLECIKRALRPPRGVALVAAKSHYFGVGGGTAAFLAAVAADGALEARRAWVDEGGASNKREIIKLAFPASIAPYFQ